MLPDAANGKTRAPEIQLDRHGGGHIRAGHGPDRVWDLSAVSNARSAHLVGDARSDHVAARPRQLANREAEAARERLAADAARGNPFDNGRRLRTLGPPPRPA